MSKKELTVVTTTGLTVATGSGYTETPVLLDLADAQAPIRNQWNQAVGALSETFFTESGSSKCLLEELEISMELKAEGGFRYILSGNLSVAGTIRAKFRRKD